MLCADHTYYSGQTTLCSVISTGLLSLLPMTTSATRLRQCEQSGVGDGSESEDPDWVKVVNRGGALHCRTEFIHFPCTVEMVVNRR